MWLELRIADVTHQCVIRSSCWFHSTLLQYVTASPHYHSTIIISMWIEVRVDDFTHQCVIRSSCWFYSTLPQCVTTPPHHHSMLPHYHITTVCYHITTVCYHITTVPLLLVYGWKYELLISHISMWLESVVAFIPHHHSMLPHHHITTACYHIATLTQYGYCWCVTGNTIYLFRM